MEKVEKPSLLLIHSPLIYWRATFAVIILFCSNVFCITFDSQKAVLQIFDPFLWFTFQSHVLWLKAHMLGPNNFMVEKRKTAFECDITDDKVDNDWYCVAGTTT